MEPATVKEYVDKVWREECIPKLEEYIRIPNLSPYFTTPDNVEAKENQDKAMKLIVDWVASQDVKGMTHELFQVEERTPLLFIEVPASENVSIEDVGTVLLYGHMDKQPPFTGWAEGLSPYTPVIKNDRLYGRGGADDGYACFCAVTAIRTLQQHNIPHGRCVIIVEACEESGSADLPFYIEMLKDRIGNPNLVVCLDSGCGNYEQLWVTNTLRGICVGKLKVELLSEGVHSGDGSGVIPDTFRIARNLLERIEDSETGTVKLDALNVQVPEKYQEQVASCAQVLAEKGMVQCFPFLDGCQPVQVEDGKDKLTELALNRWWRPQVAVVGADGLPPAGSAGNVLRPFTTLTLSIRLPPTLNTKDVIPTLTKVLTENPPYGAKVSFEAGKIGRGWAAPPVAPWLESAANEASNAYYGKDAMYMGEGGSIPFMGMLGEMFPQAQFFIVGCLGPNSNAHGPNEFLHIDFSSKLTSCVAHVVGLHCTSEVEKMLQRAEPSSKRQKTDDLNENFGRNADGTKF